MAYFLKILPNFCFGRSKIIGVVWKIIKKIAIPFLRSGKNYAFLCWIFFFPNLLLTAKALLANRFYNLNGAFIWKVWSEVLLKWFPIGSLDHIVYRQLSEDDFHLLMVKKIILLFKCGTYFQGNEKLVYWFLMDSSFKECLAFIIS